MDKVLVCEGVCNGGRVQRFDAEVLAVAPDRERIGPSTFALARRFIYTLHLEVARNRFKCAVCGTARRFGKDLHTWC